MRFEIASPFRFYDRFAKLLLFDHAKSKEIMKDYPNAWILANTMSCSHNFIDSIISFSPKNEGDPDIFVCYRHKKRTRHLPDSFGNIVLTCFQV
jgi:hypothetical protein